MNDGGPAFPAELSNSGPQSGMSLRDYFAAKAMHGELAAQDYGNCVYTPKLFGELAHNSYLLADAMLAEREKPVPA